MVYSSVQQVFFLSILALPVFYIPFQIRGCLPKEMSLSNHHWTSESHLKLPSHYLANVTPQLSEQFLENFLLGFLAAKFKQRYFTTPKTSNYLLHEAALKGTYSCRHINWLWGSWRASFRKGSVVVRDISLQREFSREKMGLWLD